MAESIKSKYKPHYPNKYQGDSNNIICRSSWERKFCSWCDLNESIISWASEEFSIFYLSPIDNKIHKYFPDFIIKVKENNEEIKTYVVEIKPKKQTLPPKPKSRVTKGFIYEAKTYAVNQAKWNAAEEWCKNRMINFMIVTEDQLGIK